MVKKKIAIIGLKGLPATGGAARSIESVLKNISDKYEFVVYSIDSHTNKNGFFDGYYQKVFRSIKHKNLNTFIYYIKSMIHCIFFGNYDLIIINHAESGFIIPFLRIRYKVITILHGVYSNDRYEDKFSYVSNQIFKFFQWFTFKFSNYLISVSKYEIPFCKKNKSSYYLHSKWN